MMDDTYMYYLIVFHKVVVILYEVVCSDIWVTVYSQYFLHTLDMIPVDSTANLIDW